MASMKSVVLPLLEELSVEDDTRMGLWKRCTTIIANWENFKVIMTSLIADGLIEKKSARPATGGDIAVFGLTAQGVEVVNTFTVEE